MSYVVYKDRLKGAYAEAFAQAELYAGLQNLDGDTLEEALMELVDALCAAQEEGKPVEKVLGRDMERFCRDYFKHRSNLLGRGRDLLKMLYRCGWFFLVGELLFLLPELLDGNCTLITASTDVSGYLVGLLSGLLGTLAAGLLLRPFLFRWKKLSMGWYLAVDLVFSLGLMAAGIWFLWDRTVSIPVLPVWLGVAAYVAGYKAVQLRKRYKATGSLKKPEEEREFHQIWKAAMEDTTQNDVPRILKKRFLRNNRWRQRFRKPPLTREEFMCKLEWECRNARKINWIAGMVLFAVLLLGTVLGMFPDCTTVADYITAFVPLILGMLVYWGTVRMFTKADDARAKLLQQCREQGINVLDLAEQKSQDHGG